MNDTTPTATPLSADEKLLEIQRILDVDKETTAIATMMVKVGLATADDAIRTLAQTQAASLDTIEKVLKSS